ncbi:MAG: hypothetical protein J7M18_06325 [Candidatus Eremiobacteraeota bacterium]|nr:hypothetical protein [Candidatus Eremiobacteraeota bacterium]
MSGSKKRIDKLNNPFLSGIGLDSVKFLRAKEECDKMINQVDITEGNGMIKKAGADVHIKSAGITRKPAARKKTEKIPKDKLVRSLKYENIQLKKKIKALKSELTGVEKKKPSAKDKIQIDFKTGEITGQKIKYKGLDLDEFDITGPDPRSLLKEVLSTNFFNSSAEDIKNVIGANIENSPIVVKKLNVRISDDMVTKSLLKNKMLKKEGIHDVSVDFFRGKMKFSGRYGKTLPVPFTTTGTIGVDKKGNPKLKIDDISILGILPAPKILKNILFSMMGDRLASDVLKHNGDTFTMDLSAILPKNVEMKLRKADCKKGYLVLEASHKVPKKTREEEIGWQVAN